MKVAVVGGGPSGVAAALHLARQGHLVDLIEASPEPPIQKACGEGIMPRGISELIRLGWDPRPHGETFGGIRFSTSKQFLRGDFPEGSESQPFQGVGISRPTLIRALWDQARRQPGLRIRLGTRVQGLVWDGDRVRGLRLEGSVLATDWVVAADGRFSRLRKAAGLEAPTRRSGPQRIALVGRGPRPRSFPRVEVHLAPKGEVYLTPVEGDSLRWVYAAWIDPGQKDPLSVLKAELEGAIQTCPGLAFARAHGAPEELQVVAGLSSKAKDLGIPGLILVGDAAGAVDPITGEGVSLGLVSARLFAEALAQGEGSDQKVLRAYRRGLRAPRFEACALAQGMLFLRRLPWLESWVLGRLARDSRLYPELLGVAAGTRELSQVSLRTWLGPLWGRSSGSAAGFDRPAPGQDPGEGSRLQPSY